MMLNAKNLVQEKDLSNNSSTHVVDMLSYKELQAGICKENLSCGSLSSTGDEIVPPLDHVTVTTTSEAADEEDGDGADSVASTCSSLSCDIPGTSSEVQPRSIFAEYWKSEGMDTAPFFRAVAPPNYYPPITASSERSGCSRDSELLLKEVEARSTPQGLRRTQARRSIFGMQQEFGEQTPSRHPEVVPQQEQNMFQQKDLFRKTTSDPTFGIVQKKQPRSSLRCGRFSSSERVEKSCSKIDEAKTIHRSVSFNDHVDIKVFHNPSSSMLVERWAANGWSNYFA